MEQSASTCGTCFLCKWTNWMPIGLNKKWCTTTAQKFQEPETEVLQRKLQKFYAHSFVKLMWA